MQNRSGRVSGCAACWGKGRPTTQFDSVSAKVSHLREAAQPCSCGLAKKPRSLLTFASPCVSNATPIYFFVRASVHCDCKQPVGCLWSTFSLTVRRGHAGDPQFLWAWWTCVGQCCSGTCGFADFSWHPERSELNCTLGLDTASIYRWLRSQRIQRVLEHVVSMKRWGRDGRMMVDLLGVLGGALITPSKTLTENTNA